MALSRGLLVGREKVTMQNLSLIRLASYLNKVRALEGMTPTWRSEDLRLWYQSGLLEQDYSPTEPSRT